MARIDLYRDDNIRIYRIDNRMRIENRTDMYINLELKNTHKYKIIPMWYFTVKPQMTSMYDLSVYGSWPLQYIINGDFAYYIYDRDTDISRDRKK